MTTVLESRKVRPVLTEGIVLHNISWSTYESLLRDCPDAPSPRFTYDRGDLLIMVTSPEHEEINVAISILINTLAEELNIEWRGFGSTTYKREDLQRGFEPDACFYFENESLMRGKKRLDLSRDPAPDLVVEIDITNSTMKKLELFAAFKIPEVWRFDGSEVRMYWFREGQYIEREHSLALPPVTVGKVNQLLNMGQSLGRLEWIKIVRTYAREIVNG